MGSQMIVRKVTILLLICFSSHYFFSSFHTKEKCELYRYSKSDCKDIKKFLLATILFMVRGDNGFAKICTNLKYVQI